MGNFCCRSKKLEKYKEDNKQNNSNIDPTSYSDQNINHIL